MMVRRMVDLPAPLDPMSVTTSPWSTPRETPLMASTPSYLTRISLTSKSILNPQIGFNDLPVPADFLGRAFGDLLSVVQHHNALAELHDGLHVVLHHNQGDTPLPEAADEGHHGGAFS